MTCKKKKDCNPKFCSPFPSPDRLVFTQDGQSVKKTKKLAEMGYFRPLACFVCLVYRLRQHSSAFWETFNKMSIHPRTERITSAAYQPPEPGPDRISPHASARQTKHCNLEADCGHFPVPPLSRIVSWPGELSLSGVEQWNGDHLTGLEQLNRTLLERRLFFPPKQMAN